MPIVIIGALLLLAGAGCIYYIVRNSGGAIREHKLESLDIKQDEQNLDEQIRLKEEELKGPSGESETK